MKYSSGDGISIKYGKLMANHHMKVKAEKQRVSLAEQKGCLIVTPTPKNPHGAISAIMRDAQASREDELRDQTLGGGASGGYEIKSIEIGENKAMSIDTKKSEYKKQIEDIELFADVAKEKGFYIKQLLGNISNINNYVSLLENKLDDKMGRFNLVTVEKYQEEEQRRFIAELRVDKLEEDDKKLQDVNKELRDIILNFKKTINQMHKMNSLQMRFAATLEKNDKIMITANATSQDITINEAKITIEDDTNTNLLFETPTTNNFGK